MEYYRKIRKRPRSTPGLLPTKIEKEKCDASLHSIIAQLHLEN
jgi:hypothetical protein